MSKVLVNEDSNTYKEWVSFVKTDAGVKLAKYSKSRKYLVNFWSAVMNNRILSNFKV